MPLVVNGQTIPENCGPITVNGNEVKKIICNGTTVWQCDTGIITNKAILVTNDGTYKFAVADIVGLPLDPRFDNINILDIDTRPGQEYAYMSKNHKNLFAHYNNGSQKVIGAYDINSGNLIGSSEALPIPSISYIVFCDSNRIVALAEEYEGDTDLYMLDQDLNFLYNINVPSDIYQTQGVLYHPELNRVYVMFTFGNYVDGAYQKLYYVDLTTYELFETSFIFNATADTRILHFGSINMDGTKIGISMFNGTTLSGSHAIIDVNTSSILHITDVTNVPSDGNGLIYNPVGDFPCFIDRAGFNPIIRTDFLSDEIYLSGVFGNTLNTAFSSITEANGLSYGISSIEDTAAWYDASNGILETGLPYPIVQDGFEMARGVCIVSTYPFNEAEDE